MVRKLPRESFYDIKDPVNQVASMRADITLLWAHDRYISCTALILAFLDALAAGNGQARKRKFMSYVQEHFSELADALGPHAADGDGAKLLYESYRNDVLHRRAPERGFALCENGELGGRYADTVQVEGLPEMVGLNVERLYADFLAHLNEVEAGTP